MVNYEFSCLREIVLYAEKHKEFIGTKLMDMPINFIHMYYPISELAEEVLKRTSYIGKSKTTEDGQHLLDVIAMTKDEGDVFSSFIEDAAASVYDSISGMGRRLCNSFMIHAHEKSHVITENHGITITPSINSAIYDSVTNKITTDYNITLDKSLEDNDELVMIISVTYTYLDCLAEPKQKIASKEIKIHNGDPLSGTISLDIDLDTTTPTTQYVLPEQFDHIDTTSIDAYIQDTTPTTINIHDWVEYNLLDGGKELYQAMNKATTNSDLHDRGMFEPVSFVINEDSIHFVIEEPHNMNHNGILGADIALKNAIVAFVEYRWFELLGLNDISQIAYAEHQRSRDDLKKRLSYTITPRELRTRWF